MAESLTYQELSDALSRMGSSESPAGYHGALCGALCVRRPDEIDPLQLLPADDDTGIRRDRDAQLALARACEEALVALQDSDMVFTPLLPDDEQALAPRVQALTAWCEGFLFGLASKPGLDLARCSADAREIIQDFTDFTRASTDEDEDDPSLEEGAYAELVEYIRVGAQLVFMEFRPAPTPDPTESRQLH